FRGVQLELATFSCCSDGEFDSSKLLPVRAGKMTREQIRKRIVEIGIVPIVRATSATQARQAAEAVCAGGIPIVEVTMTVPGAIDVIKELIKSLGTEVLVGA